MGDELQTSKTGLHYRRPISVHHPEFIIHPSPFTLHNSLRPCEYSLPTAITEVQTMANPEHFKILKQGVAAWNKWRMENSGIFPNLIETDLRGANFSGVNLSATNLSGAWLTWADLRGAALIDANLTAADLRGANLRTANLGGAQLSGASLERADFTEALVAFTVFGNNDLGTVKGVETVHHLGPSTIGIDTIYKSKGNIPEAFLRGAGVPEDFITYMKSLVGKAIEFYSCFISYSSKDDDFAQRLYADLQAKNVRCWKFDENAKWGEPLWGEIDTAIRHYDKLVVICSEHSLQSPPVIREIERALQKEDREHRNVLFPIRIDDYLFDEWEHPRKADVVIKVIGDFRGWDNLATYSKAFPRFLDALNCPQSTSHDKQP
jgi:uncharacterized protein YjbI with pentapeptide repeats